MPEIGKSLSDGAISPLEGEMAGRPEGGGEGYSHGAMAKALP